MADFGNNPPPSRGSAPRVRWPAGALPCWLLVATLLCYAIGYPLALLAHSNVGWVFVSLGGVLLVALLAVLVRRLAL